MMRRNIFLKVLRCVKLKKNEEFIWGILKKKNVYTYFKVFFQLLEINEEKNEKRKKK